MPPWRSGMYAACDYKRDGCEVDFHLNEWILSISHVLQTKQQQACPKIMAVRGEGSVWILRSL